MASVSSASEIAIEGPVLSLVNKRLRALRKKLNRINQMEESRCQGKTLNKEQEETLLTKPSLLAGIDELEKLRLPLSRAVDQEIELYMEKNKQKSDVTAEIQNEAEPEANGEYDGVSEVSDLLNLLYFATVFDVKTLMRAHDNMLTRTHERNCCLTYDYVTDEDTAEDPLKEWDLDIIATLGAMLTSRPVNSRLSHKNALQKCVEHAKLWLAKADQPIEPDSTITYAGLREKLSKIMASDYFTTAPEIKAPVEVAAAAGDYVFQLPGHASITIPVSASEPTEGSAVNSQKEEEQSPTSPSNDVYYDETGKAHQEVSEVENVSEVQPQAEHAIPDTEIEQNSRDEDLKEQQHTTRKPYQNYRGGRGGANRRGYGNSRGGRGNGRGDYQNGRNLYYDQPGGYYPRNNYNYRGRGGRGAGPPNYSRHHAPVVHENHSQVTS
ncbi:uncharacterized protein LOC127264048 [Andrographis paniculata]|uniref:uncharacterized protein LOC127264048 n=1 Tax=Andrographis paniculata TaxID=175694 RepID=UPI0021E7F2A1|nr:uncharacterized protein LOC127264048 [Andrographis paniculata]